MAIRAKHDFYHRKIGLAIRINIPLWTINKVCQKKDQTKYFLYRAPQGSRILLPSS